jgi:hypothetical protein
VADSSLQAVARIPFQKLLHYDIPYLRIGISPEHASDSELNTRKDGIVHIQFQFLFIFETLQSTPLGSFGLSNEHWSVAQRQAEGGLDPSAISQENQYLGM